MHAAASSRPFIGERVGMMMYLNSQSASGRSGYLHSLPSRSLFRYTNNSEAPKGKASNHALRFCFFKWEYISLSLAIAPVVQWHPKQPFFFPSGR